jgi:hypothetical protein
LPARAFTEKRRRVRRSRALVFMRGGGLTKRQEGEKQVFGLRVLGIEFGSV